MISAGIFRTDAANFLGKLAIFFRYQRSIHKEFSKNFRRMFDIIKGFLNVQRFSREPECK